MDTIKTPRKSAFRMRTALLASAGMALVVFLVAFFRAESIDDLYAGQPNTRPEYILYFPDTLEEAGWWVLLFAILQALYLFPAYLLSKLSKGERARTTIAFLYYSFNAILWAFFLFIMWESFVPYYLNLADLAILFYGFPAQLVALGILAGMTRFGDRAQDATDASS